jgi:peptidoglycan/xylan/chitin deacetylase (PgdA/CDA1 family)
MPQDEEYERHVLRRWAVRCPVPAIARRTVAEGNRLGNHTYNTRPDEALTPTAIAKEFSDTTAAMQRAVCRRRT